MKGTISYQIGLVGYTVNHYAQGLDGAYPTEPTTTETLYGVEGDLTQAKALDMEGFTAQGFSQTTVKPDGTAAVSIRYSRDYYQVYFDGNGQSIDTPRQAVEYGAAVTRPANPVSGGLTFGGWFTDADCTQAFNFENTTMPASDMTLYAKWSLTPIDFDKATVDTADKTYSAQEIEPAVSIDGLTKGADYTVTYSDNVKVGTASIKVAGTGSYTGEKTYSFVIAPAEVKVSGITARDKDRDGSVDAQLDCSKAVIKGLCEADTGKVTVTAKGAFEDANVRENKKVAISDIVLQGDAAANYKLAADGQQTETTATIVGKYTIAYGNADGATNPNPTSYKPTDDDIVLADASRDGYDFEGWYDRDGSADNNWGNKVTLIAKGTDKDVTVYAKWNAKTYHLVYRDNNGEGRNVKECDVKCGDKLSDTVPKIDTADNIVTGWYTSEPLTTPDAKQWDFDKDTMPAQDLTLFAKWHAKYCTITLLDTDESVTPVTRTLHYGDTYTPVLEDISGGVAEDGKVFNYWYYDKAGTQRFDSTKPIYDDLIVYGQRFDYAYWLDKDNVQSLYRGRMERSV